MTNARTSLLLAALFCCAAPLAQPAGGASGDAQDDRPGKVRLAMPPTLYATPGVEANVYFDNVMLVPDRDDYAFEVVCDHGNQLEERWTFTPRPEHVGSFPLTVVVRDGDNAVVARASTTVQVAPSAEARLSLLLVGDSLTDTKYSHYPQRLVELDAADESLELQLIGSRGLKEGPPDGPVRHEGYGGWTAEAFVTLNGPASRTGVNKRPETGSPFVYPDAGGGGAARLDFARYCREFNGGAAPDAILIVLGTNDVFRADDQTIDATIDASLGHFDTLIAEFRRAGPGTAVGIALPTPPALSQDGFRNYAGARRQTRWQYRRNQHRLVERMIAHYAGREAERVYLVPGYLNLDAARGFRTYEALPHAGAAAKVVRTNDGVHPSREGHFQIADSFYCWLKAVAATRRPEGG